MNQEEVLIEQYKLMEGRRNYFGHMFWQIPGFFIAVFAVTIGLASKGESNLLLPSMGVGGVILLVIGRIAHRLAKAQDECEEILSQIESKLRKNDFSDIVEFPKGIPLLRFGARGITLAALLVAAAALITVFVVSVTS